MVALPEMVAHSLPRREPVPIGSSLRSAYPSHGLMRFGHLDPPELIRSREIAGKAAAACSGGLEDGSLDQNASGRILPERDQQLARQSNDHRLACTARL